MSLKKGQKLTINGEKLIVASINDDGTATLNYAAGSGKSGFRGKIVNPDSVKAATSPKAMFVDSIDPIDDIDDDIVSLNEYDNASKSAPVPTGYEDRFSALASRGVDSKILLGSLTRPIGDSDQPVTEKQINSRLNVWEARQEVLDKMKEIEQHKFPLFTKRLDKVDYYENAAKEVSQLSDNLNLARIGNQISEQTEEWSYSRTSPMKNSYQYEQDGPKEFPNLPEQKAAWDTMREANNLSRNLKKEAKDFREMNNWR